jgi:hypothetical protein
MTVQTTRPAAQVRPQIEDRDGRSPAARACPSPAAPTPLSVCRLGDTGDAMSL